MSDGLVSSIADRLLAAEGDTAQPVRRTTSGILLSGQSTRSAPPFARQSSTGSSANGTLSKQPSGVSGLRGDSRRGSLMKTSGLSQMSTTIVEEEAPPGDDHGLDKGFVALVGGCVWSVCLDWGSAR